MRRRTLVISAAVVAIAVLLVTGQLLMTRRLASPETSPPSATASLELTSQTGVPGLVPPLPGGKRLPSAAPSGPLRDGFPLHPLSSSPTGLIAGMSPTRIPAGSTYSVTFRPWGYGPAGPTGQTVVITATSISASGTAPDISSLSKTPVLAVMDARYEGEVSVGGRHTGTLTFLSNGGQVIPVLSRVQATD